VYLAPQKMAGDSRKYAKCSCLRVKCEPSISPKWGIFTVIERLTGVMLWLGYSGGTARIAELCRGPNNYTLVIRSGSASLPTRLRLHQEWKLLVTSSRGSPLSSHQTNLVPAKYRS